MTDRPTHRQWLTDIHTNHDWPTRKPWLTYTQTMADWPTHKHWLYTQTLIDWPTYKPWRQWKHTVSPNTMKNLQVAFLDLLPTQGPWVTPTKSFGWSWRRICPWTTIIQPSLNIYCWTNKTWNKSKFSAVDLAKRSFHSFLLLPLIIMMIILRREW